LEPTEISYWDTGSEQLKKLSVGPKTVLGFGKGEKGLLLVRQDTPDKISVESVE